MYPATNTLSKSNSISDFNELLEPFEKCYCHVRAYGCIHSFGDRVSLERVLAESAADVQQKIEDLFIPMLSNALHSNPRPNTTEVEPLYQLVPKIRNYMALSNLFLASSIRYLCSPAGSEARTLLQQLLARSTEIMEYHASFSLEALLGRLSESAIRELLKLLTEPTYAFADPVFDFERIPAAQAELNHCSFTDKDHVLFIGCGSLSVSGLAYANAGARVTLVDIDPHALESFSRVYSALPESFQKRIKRQVVAPGEYCYIAKTQYSHVSMAGLVGGKDQILEAMQNCLACCENTPRLLVRTPKPNLLQLFYYDADIANVAQNHFVVSDQGIEAPLVTNVFDLRATEYSSAKPECKTSSLEELFTEMESGVLYPHRLNQ